MELLLVFVSLCLNKTSLHYPNKSATWMKKCQRKFQKTDTIQTERDHILMLLKRWRTSREETEIQKTKDFFEDGKPSVTCLQKKKINKQTITNRLKNIVKVGLDLSFIYIFIISAASGIATNKKTYFVNGKKTEMLTLLHSLNSGCYACQDVPKW